MRKKGRMPPWTDEEKDWVLWAVGECEEQVNGNKFWELVREKAMDRGLNPKRSIAAVYRIARLMNLKPKIINNDTAICLGCSRVGILNRKFCLCTTCYDRLQKKGVLK